MKAFTILCVLGASTITRGEDGPPAGGEINPVKQADPVEQADLLMRKQTLPSYEAALDLYRAARMTLSDDPPSASRSRAIHGSPPRSSASGSARSRRSTNVVQSERASLPPAQLQ